MNKPDIVLAIDPSVRLSGFAEYNPADGHGRASWTVARPKGLKGGRFLKWYYGILGERLYFADYDKPSRLLVVEGYSFGSRGRAVVQMGELGGVIRLQARMQRWPMAVVAPGTLKKYATGRGAASKNEVLAAAVRKLGFEGHDDNEADALWLLEMALRHYGMGATGECTQYQRRALAAVDWPVYEEVPE